MIAHVFGKVAEKFNGSLVIDVHGVGYEVSVAAGDFDAVVLDQDVKFYTYHHVREQAEELFGFSSLAAKKMFVEIEGWQEKGYYAVGYVSYEAAPAFEEKFQVHSAPLQKEYLLYFTIHDKASDV